MAQFKKIVYGKLLYETLRNYFSVNAAGELSVLYKFLYACAVPMQVPFNTYDDARRISALIAMCKWQVGQLTNLLNYLFDPQLQRISISQSEVTTIKAPTFEYNSTLTAPDRDGTTNVYGRVFGDGASQSKLIINIPDNSLFYPVKAVIEQVRIQGINYQIQSQLQPL